MKQLYIIVYENSRWCGGELNVLVWATSEDEANELASDFMEETQRELFSDQEDEEEEDDEYEDSAVTINSTKLLDDSDHNEFTDRSGDETYYPMIGTS